MTILSRKTQDEFIQIITVRPSGIKDSLWLKLFEWRFIQVPINFWVALLKWRIGKAFLPIVQGLTEAIITDRDDNYE
jgi:hypothetical protein